MAEGPSWSSFDDKDIRGVPEAELVKPLDPKRLRDLRHNMAVYQAGLEVRNSLPTKSYYSSTPPGGYDGNHFLLQAALERYFIALNAEIIMQSMRLVRPERQLRQAHPHIIAGVEAWSELRLPSYNRTRTTRRERAAGLFKAWTGDNWHKRVTKEVEALQQPENIEQLLNAALTQFQDRTDEIVRSCRDANTRVGFTEGYEHAPTFKYKFEIGAQPIIADTQLHEFESEVRVRVQDACRSVAGRACARVFMAFSTDTKYASSRYGDMGRTFNSHDAMLAADFYFARFDAVQDERDTALAQMSTFLQAYKAQNEYRRLGGRGRHIADEVQTLRALLKSENYRRIDSSIPVAALVRAAHAEIPDAKAGKLTMMAQGTAAHWATELAQQAVGLAVKTQYGKCVESVNRLTDLVDASRSNESKPAALMWTQSWLKRQSSLTVVLSALGDVEAALPAYQLATEAARVWVTVEAGINVPRLPAMVDIKAMRATFIKAYVEDANKILKATAHLRDVVMPTGYLTPWRGNRGLLVGGGTEGLKRLIADNSWSQVIKADASDGAFVKRIRTALTSMVEAATTTVARAAAVDVDQLRSGLPDVPPVELVPVIDSSGRSTIAEPSILAGLAI